MSNRAEVGVVGDWCPSSKVWQMSYKSIRHFGMKKL